MHLNLSSVQCNQCNNVVLWSVSCNAPFIICSILDALTCVLLKDTEKKDTRYLVELYKYRDVKYGIYSESRQRNTMQKSMRSLHSGRNPKNLRDKLRDDFRRDPADSKKLQYTLVVSVLFQPPNLKFGCLLHEIKRHK